MGVPCTNSRTWMRAPAYCLSSSRSLSMKRGVPRPSIAGLQVASGFGMLAFIAFVTATFCVWSISISGMEDRKGGRGPISMQTLLAGLPGLFIYKAVNTADSMIGHKEPRWRDFGWAAARVDDVMNVSAHRISTIEVESALVDHQSVAEAAVVGKNDPLTGQAIFAFVILKKGVEASEAFASELRAHVAKQIGAIARPKFLLFVPDLPKTRSGKIMRRLLRDIAEGRALGDVTTLADGNVVETIRSNTGAAEE
mgnify:CR=1 FL=1